MYMYILHVICYTLVYMNVSIYWRSEILKKIELFIFQSHRKMKKNEKEKRKKRKTFSCGGMGAPQTLTFSPNFQP